LGCTLYQDVQIHSYNTYPTFKPYTINGYRLADVLKALGADMSAVKNTSTLLTTASDGNKVTITGNLITAPESYIALEYAENHTPGAPKSASKTPRLFPAANYTPPGVSGVWVNNGLCNSNIASFTLTYN